MFIGERKYLNVRKYIPSKKEYLPTFIDILKRGGNGNKTLSEKAISRAFLTVEGRKKRCVVLNEGIGIRNSV